MSFPATGRLVGVDPGAKRVGLAITDPERRVVSPLTTLTRTTPERDALVWLNLATSEGVLGFVVGLPVLLSGEEGTQARLAREFGVWIAEVTARPVTFWDERFTSSAADDALIGAGLTRGKRAARRDRVAAVFILEAYLASNPT